MSDDEGSRFPSSKRPFDSDNEDELDDSRVSSDSESDTDQRRPREEEPDEEDEEEEPDKEEDEEEGEDDDDEPEDGEDEDADNDDDSDHGSRHVDEDENETDAPSRRRQGRKRQLVSLHDLEFDPTFMDPGAGNATGSVSSRDDLMSEDGDNTSDDDDDENEDGRNYLQKFDAEMSRGYVEQFHPEVLQESYEEVCRMATVVRNAEGLIVDPLHKTVPILTKYERTRVLGQRAKQLEQGATPLVKVPDSIIDGYLIAELELKEKKIPIILRRPLPNGAFEYWRLQDLEILL